MVVPEKLRTPVLVNLFLIPLLVLLQELWRPIPDHPILLAVVTSGWACSFWLLHRLAIPANTLWPLLFVCIAFANALLQAPEGNYFAFSHFMGLGYALPVMALAAASAGSHHLRNIVLTVSALAGIAVLTVGMLYSSPNGTKPFWGLEQLESQLRLIFPSDAILSHPGLPDGRVNRNALGGASVLLLPLYAGMLSSAFLNRSWPSATLALAGLGLAFMGLLVSKSSTALAAVAILLLVSASKRRRTRPSAILAVIALIATVSNVRLVEVEEGTQRQFAYLRESGIKRATIYREAANRALRNPIAGIGLSQFRSDSRSAAVHSQAENIVLQSALDLGIPGTLSLFALLWQAGKQKSFKESNKSPLRRLVASVGRSTILGYLLFGITDVIALGSRVGTIMWIGVGLAISSRIQVEPVSSAGG